jgi:hypothetical protein
MDAYNALPQISKYKSIYDSLLSSSKAGRPGYNALWQRWDELQLGSWPALTDGANYTDITDYPLGPAPINTWTGVAPYITYSDNTANGAGPPPPPPGWRVPFSPRSYYASGATDEDYSFDARFQTDFLLTNARLVMGFDEPRERDDPRDLTKFAQIQGICDAYRGQANTMVNSSVNSGIVATTFTGMQDLSTGGVSQVSPSFAQFGGDLVSLGELINLRTLSYLGYPSNLLRQMLNVGGLLPGVYDALVLAQVTDQNIATVKQLDAEIGLDLELKIYQGLMMVTGESLAQVLELLDISQSNANSAALTQPLTLANAADLLNPAKILPNSYLTLLMQITGADGKTQDVKIYSSANTVNSSIASVFVDDELYNNLRKVIPPAQALANSALIRSLRQVKNVTNLEFQEFAASTKLLENNDGLPSVNALTAPVPAGVQTAVNDSLATGTGPNDSLTLYDLIGTAAGAVHQEKFTQTMEQFKTVDFSELIRLYNLCLGVIGGTYDIELLSIAPPTLTSGGANYTSASATITPPTGPYCQVTPTFNVTVTVDPFSGVGPVTAITATSLGSGYEPGDAVNITISGDGGGATATTTLSTQTFAYVELPDGRQFEACGDEYAGRLKALQALTYSGSGGDNSLPGPWNTVELEAKRLVNTYPDQVAACNTYWAEMAAQMNREAMNRYLAELIFDFATATYPDLKPYSRSSALAMISSLHGYGTETSQNGAADFFNAVAQTNLGGQSVIASLREGRNIEALIDAGAGIDTQLPSSPQ